MEFTVYYKNGLHRPALIEAKDKQEAFRKGLAEYRRNYGFYNLLSNWPTEKVVDKVVPLQKALRKSH